MPRKPNPELTDDENPELTEADFARMRPAVEVLREQFGSGAEHLLKPKRRRSAGDGHYVSIAMSPFRTLYEVLDAPHLAAYDNLETLFAKRDEVWRAVDAETRKFDRDALLDKMLAVDSWCAAVNDIRAAAEDPQVAFMGMIGSYEHPTAGTVRVVAPAVKMSATPAAIDRPAPLVGQHGREILAEYGLGPDEIAALEADGVMTVTEA
jgi:crotonobetainyl-CoA:carnitine CoA-transferase CaiB-like acyl-CoA transferase